MNQHDNIAILILAAGSSSRMGQSKQLLPWGNDTLLTHACHTALRAGVARVAVAVGARAAEHKTLLQSVPVEVVVNDEWSTGMGSSIQKGITFLLDRDPQLKAVLIMACDQPFITTSHLRNLIDKHLREAATIVATRYADAYGVPVLFSSSHFQELKELPHSTGARKIVENNFKRASFVFFEDGKIDLDTPDDYAKFVNQLNK